MKITKNYTKQENTKRNKFPIINNYPWRCNGIQDHWHPEIENYSQDCDFPGCQQKCFQIPYREKSFLQKTIGLGVGLIACAFLLPMIFEAYRYYTYNDKTKFNYGGATPFNTIYSSEKKETIEDNLSKIAKIPGLNLNYQQNPQGIPGTTSGIKMLIEGQLDFAHASRPLTVEEKTKATNRDQDKPFTIKQNEVANDGIAIFINPDLNISQLTVEQLTDLFTGTIRNWKELGGDDIPVVPISLNSKSEDGDTADFFQNFIGGNFPDSNSYEKIKTPTQVMQCVSGSQDCPVKPVKNFKGAIGYASASLVCNQEKVKVIALSKNGGNFINPCINQNVNTSAFDGSYPITRKLFIITKQDKGHAQKVGEAYIKMLKSKQGQQLLKDAGFAPIFGNQ